MPRESAAVALRLLKAHRQAVDPAQEPWIHLRVAEEGLLASRNRLLALIHTAPGACSAGHRDYGYFHEAGGQRRPRIAMIEGHDALSPTSLTLSTRRLQLRA